MEKSEKKISQPSWQRHRSLNFSIGLVLSLTMVITAFEWNFKSPLTNTPIHTFPITTEMEESEVIVLKVPAPPKPIPILESEDIIEIEKPEKKEVDPLKDLPIEDTKVDGPADFTDIPATMAPGKETTEKATYELIPAEPFGGMEAFYQHLYKNIHYPAHWQDREFSVTVVFDVDEKGKVTNIQIKKATDKALEKEIIRVLKNSPAWKPAQLGAKKVKTSFKIPFSFNIR